VHCRRTLRGAGRLPRYSDRSGRLDTKARDSISPRSGRAHPSREHALEGRMMGWSSLATRYSLDFFQAGVSSACPKNHLIVLGRRHHAALASENQRRSFLELARSK